MRQWRRWTSTILRWWWLQTVFAACRTTRRSSSRTRGERWVSFALLYSTWIQGLWRIFYDVLLLIHGWEEATEFCSQHSCCSLQDMSVTSRVLLPRGKFVYQIVRKKQRTKVFPVYFKRCVVEIFAVWLIAFWKWSEWMLISQNRSSFLFSLHNIRQEQNDSRKYCDEVLPLP